MNKEKFQIALIIVLILLLGWLIWRLESAKKEAFNQSEELKKSILASDSLVKEADGRYAKLVNYYNTERDLKKELKKSNAELYKIIKKQDERILSLSNSIITLKSTVEEGFGKFDPADSNQIQLALKYPDQKSPFIKWDGAVDRRTARYLGVWSFGKLPLQIVLTEEKRGLWKHRLVGPEWLIIDSLSVQSLPPDQYTPTVERKLQFILGGGYYKPVTNLNWGSIQVGVGLSVFDKHNLILAATTNQEVGLNYYYKFKSFKRRK